LNIGQNMKFFNLLKLKQSTMPKYSYHMKN
jgi:hypothetical protein